MSEDIKRKPPEANEAIADSTEWDLFATKDGSLTLRHPEYDELFHSDSGALSEARGLYLQASGITERSWSSEPLRILDIGLGLGYNALSALEWALQRGQSIQLVSLEKDLKVFNALSDPKAEFKKNWPIEWQQHISQLQPKSQSCFIANFKSKKSSEDKEVEIEWTVCLGDALMSTSESCSEFAAYMRKSSFDYFWQDAFSPKKNPQLWSTQWFKQLRALAKLEAVLMTYSVSRVVKDALAEAGWSYELIPTCTGKRNWLRVNITTSNSPS
ncbi:MAG: hypothetical protein KBD78_06360 [Oligoflexales bacterium]|nr:hypothetical protein [Oligoflexales bacterium]